MAEQRVATLIVEVAGRQTNLDALLRRVQDDLRKTASGATTTADAVGNKLAPSQQRAGQNALTHAQALARLSAAQGDTAGAVAVLNSALANTDRSTTQAVRAQTQLVQLQNRLRAEANGSRSALEQLRQTASGLGTALGAIGFAVGIQQLGQFAIAAGQQANQLEKVQTTLRAVAGDQAVYAQALRIAEQNQRLFGGSLAENLGPLQQFLFISNRTGASLDELNRVAQLLATVNPAAGIEGAGFSLSELFSGDITSIVERFNLPRAAIRELLAEAEGADEIMAGVTALLAEQGVTAETLSASLNTTAATYDRLGATLSNLQVQIGAGLSAGLAPAAEGLNLVADSLARAIEQFRTGQAQIDPFNQAILAGTSSYAEYVAEVERVNAATRDGSDATNLFLNVLGAFNPGIRATAEGFIEAQSSVTLLTEAEFLAAQAANQLAAETTNTTAVILDEAAAAREAALAAEEDAISQLLLAAQNEETAQTKERLRAQAEAAAAALLASGADGAAAAAQLANSSSLIDQLTAAYFRLAAGKAAAGEAEAALQNQRAGERNIGVDPRRAAELEQLNTNRLRFEQEQARAEARTSGRGGGGGGGGSARGGGGANAGSNAAAREAQRAAEQERKFQEQRLNEQERINEQIRDAEQEHYERLLDIQRDFEEKSLAQQRDNEVGKRRSRFSFYDDLTSSELPQDIQQSLSAAYEAAFAESQRLAQAGNQKLAADYLALKQQQIEAELQFQKAVAAARARGDNAEVARLERLAQLRREYEEAELNNLQAEGDANVNARDEALGNEAERAATDQARIAEAAEQAGQRKVTATERSIEAIQNETRALQEQADLLEQLNRSGLAGTTPAGGAAATGATVPLPALPVADPAVVQAAADATGEAVSGAIGDPIAALTAQIGNLQQTIQQLASAVRSAGGRSGPFGG